MPETTFECTPEVLAQMHAESGLALRKIERQTRAVTAARLCCFLNRKGSLRVEQVTAVERVLRKALEERARRIAILLGREQADRAAISA